MFEALARELTPSRQTILEARATVETGMAPLLAKLGELLRRNVSVEDVTDLYFDLEVRTRNLEIVKKRLEELLAR